MITNSDSFIKTIRVCDLNLNQYINLGDDSVSFVNDETGHTLFNIDYAGYVKFFGVGVTETKNYIGKFGYQHNDVIGFSFNDKFLKLNPEIKINTITTSSKDFIVAEQIVVNRLITDIPSIFNI